MATCGGNHVFMFVAGKRSGFCGHVSFKTSPSWKLLKFCRRERLLQVSRCGHLAENPSNTPLSTEQPSIAP